jgi:flavin reductase (DIM6/NTAB) family NADH-FMN oxidoreductase RutF
VTEKVAFELGSEGGADGYRLLTGLVVPRPIGWIGTVREDGTYNLAPYSFFNLIAVNPPTVIFSGGRRGTGESKDSVRYAEESGEFTVNIVSEDVAEQMNVTSASYLTEVDEFAKAGLTAVPGLVVAAPMVAEAPANLECRLTQVVDIGGETGSRLVFGEVLVVHVRGDVLDGGRIDNDALKAVGRMAGSSYIHTRDRFELGRPG